MSNLNYKFKVLSEEISVSIQKEGYAVVKEFFTDYEITLYKKYILNEFKKREWYEGKTFGPNFQNYCTSWLFKKLKFISARLYIQEHSRPNFLAKRILDLKEDMIFIENIVNDKNKNNFEGDRIFFDIVSIYANKSPGYPPHRDHEPGKLELQAQHTLTIKNTDYEGGDLILHKESKKIKSNEDLKLTNKDLLLFDKSIIHSVESLKPGFTKIGRWMTLYNASVFVKGNKFNKKRTLKSLIKDLISKYQINRLKV